MEPLQGRYALVTGASGGLGVEFARELAQRGLNLILVARREEQLRQVANELTRQHRVEVETIAMDLAAPEAAANLFERVTASGKVVDILINNAGLGSTADFLDAPWERDLAMINLNIVTLLHLNKLFLPGMVERNSGYILNVASIVALAPSPGFASYAATKSFVLNFTEGLSYELRHTNVHACTLCPGTTRTAFWQSAGSKESNWIRNLTMMDSASVAKMGIQALLAGQPIKVPGLLNKLLALSIRLMPRRLSAAIAHLMLRE